MTSERVGAKNSQSQSAHLGKAAGALGSHDRLMEAPPRTFASSADESANPELWNGLVDWTNYHEFKRLPDSDTSK